jgi:hypothetical protein
MVVGGSGHLVFLSRTRLSLSQSLCAADGDPAGTACRSATARRRTAVNSLLVLLRSG